MHDDDVVVKDGDGEGKNDGGATINQVEYDEYDVAIIVTNSKKPKPHRELPKSKQR